MLWRSATLLCIISWLALCCNAGRQVRKDDPNWKVPTARNADPVFEVEGPTNQPVDLGSDLLEMEGLGAAGRRELRGAVDDRPWVPPRSRADLKGEQPAGSRVETQGSGSGEGAFQGKPEVAGEEPAQAGSSEAKASGEGAVGSGSGREVSVGEGTDGEEGSEREGTAGEGPAGEGAKEGEGSEEGEASAPEGAAGG